MSLPPGVFVIKEFERDNFDSYHIGPAHTFCFSFSLSEADPLDIKFNHVSNMAQDWSLRCWFSEKPFSLQLFRPDDDKDVFGMARQVRIIKVGSNVQNKLQLNKIYYFNVQNLQNSENSFYLQFGVDIPNPCDIY